MAACASCLYPDVCSLLSLSESVMKEAVIVEEIVLELCSPVQVLQQYWCAQASELESRKMSCKMILSHRVSELPRYDCKGSPAKNCVSVFLEIKDNCIPFTNSKKNF